MIIMAIYYKFFLHWCSQDNENLTSIIVCFFSAPKVTQAFTIFFDSLPKDLKKKKAFFVFYIRLGGGVYYDRLHISCTLCIKQFCWFVYRLDGICGLFERRLKKDNPHTRKLTYDIKDLFDYVDRLRDISCLM